jgi:hypothetical protein
MYKSNSFLQLTIFITIIVLGSGIFLLGKHCPIRGNISKIQTFIKQVPETSPDYLGEIVSKDGNLLTIKYFEKKELPFNEFRNKEELLKFMNQSSVEEKIKIGEQLKQKIIGTTTILVPLHTPIYLKKTRPSSIAFSKLKIGDFIVVWGELNKKGQVTSDFILTANPSTYEK